MPADSGERAIVATDRVSDVLARDEALVEVLVRHAPQFAKLRSRTMRRVMARLVTVESAARMAGVDVDLLLRELNETLHPGRVSNAAATPRRSDVAPPVPAPAPKAGGPPPSRKVVEVDVREDLRAGREPFSKIMAAVSGLQSGEMLLLRAIFEPVPLFAALAKRGFVHTARQQGAEDWAIWFWRPDDVPAAPPAPVAEAAAAPDVRPNGADADDSTVWLDVRGLQPPEPLMRTLAALETLPDGQQLIHVNARVPQLLFPMLAERGFACEVDDSHADRILVRIWRPAHPG